MTMPLTPHEIKELAAGYVLGDLSSEEAEQFQTCLAQMPELAVEVAALQEALAMMPYGLPEEKPQPQLRSQILAAAQTEHDQPPQVASVSSRTARIQPRWPWVMSSIAAGLAIALGVSTLRLTAQVRALQAQLQTQLANTEQAETTPEVIISPANSGGDPTASGLSWILQDHRQSLSNPDGPVDFVAQQPADIPQQLQGFQTTVAALPLLPANQGKLLGGSNCQVGETNGLRLTYQLSANQKVSAYQLPFDDDQFPQLNQFPEFQLSYVTLYQADGTGIVIWRDDAYLYALVADLPPADLQALAQTIDRI